MRPPFKDFEHLIRLAALMAVGVVVFVIVRAALVPDDFGLLGHYRASALETNAAKTAAYGGQAACVECHSDVAETRTPAGHRAISCESCHGAAARHAEDPGAMTPSKSASRELCARCHAANTGKPSWYRTVNIQEHAGDDTCTSCHAPHDPRVR